MGNKKWNMNRATNTFLLLVSKAHSECGKEIDSQWTKSLNPIKGNFGNF